MACAGPVDLSRNKVAVSGVLKAQGHGAKSFKVPGKAAKAIVDSGHVVDVAKGDLAGMHGVEYGRIVLQNAQIAIVQTGLRAAQSSDPGRLRQVEQSVQTFSASLRRNPLTHKRSISNQPYFFESLPTPFFLMIFKGQK